MGMRASVHLDMFVFVWRAPLVSGSPDSGSIAREHDQHRPVMQPLTRGLMRPACAWQDSYEEGLRRVRALEALMANSARMRGMAYDAMGATPRHRHFGLVQRVALNLAFLPSFA